MTTGPEPPEPPTDKPFTVQPVTQCKWVIVEETIVVPAGGSCTSDKHSSCRYWAGRGECRRNPSYMNTNCCKSCGVGGMMFNTMSLPILSVLHLPFRNHYITSFGGNLFFREEYCFVNYKQSFPC